jgi:hypothetical protein
MIFRQLMADYDALVSSSVQRHDADVADYSLTGADDGLEQ